MRVPFVCVCFFFLKIKNLLNYQTPNNNVALVGLLDVGPGERSIPAAVPAGHVGSTGDRAVTRQTAIYPHEAHILGEKQISRQ